jgi:hypothetical protein
MVKRIGENFQCNECKLIYKEKSIAEKCEKFCKKFNACNLEIIKHAVKQTSQNNKKFL